MPWPTTNPPWAFDRSDLAAKNAELYDIFIVSLMKRFSHLIQAALVLAVMCALLPSATVVVQAAPASEVIYTVQRGDTLSTIAARYGVTVAALQQVNGLAGTVIVVGQRLIVPETAAVAAAALGEQFRYVVKRGDTLFRLAQAYGTSVLGIQRASGITGTRLEIGDVLMIPGTGAIAGPVGVAPVATLVPAEGVTGAKTEVTVTLTPTPGKGLNTSTPAPAQISSRNLLTNPDYEGTFVKYKDSIDQQVAMGWTPWWLENGTCTNQVPRYSGVNASMLPERVYAGYKAQLVNVSGGSSFQGGLSQTVTGITAGSRIRFTAWGSAWSSTGTDPDVSLGAGSINMRVGIADGLVDASSPNIVWSRYKNYIDTYGQLSVEFIAASTSVTVFTSAYPSLCLTNNQVFWDEAALTSVVSTRYASLNDLVGTVEMRKSISGFGLAGDGQDLGVGSQVRTGPDSRARVELTEGTIISMDKNTTLTLAALGQDLKSPYTRLQLASGRIWVMHPAGTVDVETKSGTASVQGGMLSVSHVAFPRFVTTSTCLDGYCALESAGVKAQVPPGATGTVKKNPYLRLLSNPVPQITASIETAEYAQWVSNNPEAMDALEALVPDATLEIPARLATNTATTTVTVTPSVTGTVTRTSSPTTTSTVTGTPPTSTSSPTATSTTTPTVTTTPTSTFTPTATWNSLTSTNTPTPTSTSTPTPTSTSIPVIAMAGVTAQEGSTGATNSVAVTITLTKTGLSASVMAITYSTSTSAGTATGGTTCQAGVDYINTTGTLNWAALENASKTFTIGVCGDTTNEPHETVIITLSGVYPTDTLVTPAVSTTTGLLTIVNDD